MYSAASSVLLVFLLFHLLCLWSRCEISLTNDLERSLGIGWGMPLSTSAPQLTTFVDLLLPFCLFTILQKTTIILLFAIVAVAFDVLTTMEELGLIALRFVVLRHARCSRRRRRRTASELLWVAKNNSIGIQWQTNCKEISAIPIV